MESVKYGEKEKDGYELISEKFKFGDWASGEGYDVIFAVLHRAGNLIWGEFNLPIFFNSPNHQIKALAKFPAIRYYVCVCNHMYSSI